MIRMRAVIYQLTGVGRVEESTASALVVSVNLLDVMRRGGTVVH